MPRKQKIDPDNGSYASLRLKLPYTAKLIAIMCRIVGVNPDTVNYNLHTWFWQHSWNKLQEDAFIAKVIVYLRSNKDAREELMSRPSPRVRDIKKAAHEFVGMYGWKRNDIVYGKPPTNI
jgi:hypothetical protein